VLECAANLACVGAEPLGLTNCLNFGNPEKPHIAWQLTEAVRGLGDACRALDVPVVGGNVSLYNEGTEGPIYPTPVVGMVGELPDPKRAARSGFARDGDAIVLVGDLRPRIAASELAKLRGDELPDGLPAIDLAAVRATHEQVREAVRAGKVRSCHDIAEGGLAVALAECCLLGGIGAVADADCDERLFGEQPGTAFIVSGDEEDVASLGRLIGTVGGGWLQIGACSWSLEELRRAHRALAPLFP
jgi:phosphoribosylformylglycinamidine (FGAM) synthase-like enzyme